MPGPKPAAVDPAQGKMPPPDAAVRAKMLGIIKQVYEKEYELKTAAAKRQLATTMVAEAEKIKVNFTARYVLLQEAQAAAISASDAKLCRKAIDELAQSFTVDAAALTVESLSKITGVDEPTIVLWAIEAIESRIAQEDYRGARRIDAAVASRFAKSTDAALRARVKAAQATVNESDRVRLAMDRLKAAPDDPAANLAVGKFLCFHRHDWAKGLPMLSNGSDARLKDIARKDLANPSDAMACYELGGQWWDLTKDKQFATVQESFRQRANIWYEKALPGLTGIPKTMASKRLAEAPGGDDQLANVLKQMVPEGASKITALPDGTVRLDGGNLQYPTKLTVPFRADMVLKTTSENCSIRPCFGQGMVIFNWEDNPDDLRYRDSSMGNPHSSFKGKGKVPVDQFVRITWILTETGTKILVDGEERAACLGDHKGQTANFFFNIWSKPGIVIKAISFTSLPPGASEK